MISRRKKIVDSQLKSLTDTEIEFLTRFSAELIDKTVGTDEEGDKVYSLLVAAVNKILLAARSKGIASKYDVVELVTRAWLVWQKYQKDHNPEMLNSLMDIAQRLGSMAAK